MSVIHTPKKPDLDVRVLAFPVVMGGSLVVLFLRLWYFQVVKSPELVARAEVSRQDKVLREAPRGLIVDRKGNLLAGLKPEIVVTAVYDQVKKNPTVIDRVAQMLGVEPTKLYAKLNEGKESPGIAVPIYVGASQTVGTQIAEAGSDLPGIGVDLQPMRYYPDSKSFCHVLGYVGVPAKQDIKRLKAQQLGVAPFVGKSGLEVAYDKELLGAPGDEIVNVDAKRRPLRVVGRDNPVPGKELVLSLDSDLQRIAAQSLAEKNYVGGIVAMDPKTGEILCAVSSPSYDQDVFQGRISSTAWNQIKDNPDKPMVRRFMQSSYSPGSTFKIVTSIAAYEAGVFDPNRTFFCGGGYRVGKSFVKCLGHHGSISFHEALTKSCNTYFASLGVLAGPAALRKACEEVGLGSPTGVDLGNEDVGVVPTKAWMQEHLRTTAWYKGETVNFSIGQGYVRATPLQMCSMISLVANEGVSYRPHFVKEIKSIDDPSDSQTTPIEEEHHVQADASFWQTLKSALISVMENGTGRRAKIEGLTWGGKTGSTEHKSRTTRRNGQGELVQVQTKTHSWFVGFAPADNPKIAICVLVENAGHGGDVSAPIAAEIVKKYLIKPVQPVGKTSSGASASISAASLASPIVR